MFARGASGALYSAIDATTKSFAKILMLIAVLITCFNRMNGTIKCLHLLHSEMRSVSSVFKVFLVDDNSTDGTVVAVQKMFPDVTVMRGNGSLYWNRGMLLAWQEAIKDNYDSYFWLNDDTVLLEGSVSQLLSALEKNRNCIIVGSTFEPRSGKVSYGGIRRDRERFGRTKFHLITPSKKIVEADTMNGNCVLVPRSICEVVGLLDRGFRHSLGDYDYGLRATAAGFRIIIFPGYVAECERSKAVSMYPPRVEKSRMREEWRRVTDVKGLPFKDWALFCRRHCGYMWPLYWAWPYLKFLGGLIVPNRNT